MTESQIEREVVTIIESKERPMPVDWIVQETLARHRAPRGPEADFDILCRHSCVRSIVRATLRRMRQLECEDDADQMILPGYARLQKRYIVERGQQQTAIPLVQMSLAEIDAKILELESYRIGLGIHIEELKRYRKMRVAA